MDIKIHRADNVSVEFMAPPSKSYTHRALIAAALAEGTSVIRNPLYSDDTKVTADALRKLGVIVKEEDGNFIVRGTGGVLPDTGDVTIDCKNSGTSLRMLATLSVLSPSKVTLTGSKRMRERPVKGLCDALRQAGAVIEYTEKKGYPPVKISGELEGGRIIVDASKSSQFISSIMMCSPYADSPVDIMPKGSVASRSYIDITADIMRIFGADVSLTPDKSWHIPQSVYNAGDYSVEGDFSSASYFLAIAPVCRGKVRISNLNPESVQGDRVFLSLLADMGCTVTEEEDSVTVECKSTIRGADADMSSCPDIVQTLCAVSVFAVTKTTVRGISHLRYKESDRIEAIKNMVEMCGCRFSSDENSLCITPKELHGFVAEPKDDHRTAMSCAVIGLGTGDVTIKEAECVSKSFPGFWDELRRTGLLKE